MKSLLRLVFIVSYLVCYSAHASIEVLFHPTDPTLEKIGMWFREAEHTIDISMYDMETGPSSPVIAALMDPIVQERLKSGTLSIRMIYEGYSAPEINSKKMTDLEALGIDVRFLTSSKKVHHKFAVIDASYETSRVISGSANWSLSSYKNYDENILFLQQEFPATFGFETEFERLWNHSSEFGLTLQHPPRVLAPLDPANTEILTYFNSPRHLSKIGGPENNLTLQITNLINAAENEILIATTRARLVPVLEALRLAAERGVKVKIVLSQDDFHDLRKRSQWLLGHPNIEVRIKFYNLNPGSYMVYQMHNKWMMVDRRILLTGSFNWSESSEDRHIENLLVLKGVHGVSLVPAFANRFEYLWEHGRSALPGFQQNLMFDRALGVIPRCGFSPISLRYDEARDLLRLAPKCDP